MNVRRIAGLVWLLLVVFVAAAGAESRQPLSGYVIMPVGGEFLIDLDATNGVVPGDLFSVVQPGEKIVHPVTGEVIGTLDEEKGVLKVTRIKSGYSYAAPTGETAGIVRGDVIHRIEKRPEGMKTPPQQEAATVDSGLEARLRALEQKQLQVDQAAASGAPAAAASSTPYRLEAAPANAGKGPVRYRAAFAGFKNVGNLPGVVTMADMVQDGGRKLMATTDGNGVHLFSVDEGLTALAQVDLGVGTQVCSLHWWRPSVEGGLYLAVSAWKDQELRSALFALQGDQLVTVQKNLRYAFGAFDLDGDKSPETLLAQRFDIDRFWGAAVYAMHLSGGELKAESPRVDLPRDFIVQGALFADLIGSGQFQAIFVRNNMLYIYDGTKEIYRSPKLAGGSLSIVSYETNPNSEMSIPAHASFEVPPVVADLDGDGQLELIAVASDRNLLGTPGVTPGVKKSWLSVFKFREGMFVKGTLGEELEVPIQGLAVEEDRVLFVATEPASMMGQGGASHLLSISLAK